MKTNPNTIYISQRLQQRLDRISQCALTTVVAPAGYGKSIALRYFCNQVQKVGVVFWQSIFSSSMTDFWHGLCQVFGSCSRELAAAMEKMEGPPADEATRLEFVRLVWEYLPNGVPLYLILDDYHLVMNESLYDFVYFCTRRAGPNFHLIIVSRRPVVHSEDMLLLAGHVNLVTERDLRFSREDIETYFSQCGCPVSREKAQELCRVSEGWISVIYLNMISYLESGSFVDPMEIHAMMSKVLYEPLPPEQKALLTKLSILGDWTGEEAVYITENENAEQMLKNMLRSNAFLYYSGAQGTYRIHRLLQESVHKAFKNLPRDQRERVLRRAAQWARAQKEYIHAMELFYEAGDFDGIMSTLEESLGGSLNGEHRDEMLRWFRDCPQKILEAHPVAMLVYARRLFCFNMRGESKKVMDRMQILLEQQENYPQPLRNNLLGEVEINKSLFFYNDIQAMREHVKRACELMNRPSISISSRSAWNFGSASLLMSYHRIPGQVDQELQNMRETIPYWHQLNRCENSGLDDLMEAEICLYRGDLDGCEIALYRAGEHSVTAPTMEARILIWFVWLQRQLLLGKTDEVESALNALRDKVRQEKVYILFHTLDLCEAWLSCLMGRTEPLAQWIAEGNREASRLMFQAAPDTQTVYRETLLARREFAAIIAREEDDRNLCRVFPNVLCEIYQLIQLAGAFHGLHRDREAADRLQKAMDLALPDQLWFPFVVHSQWLRPVLALCPAPQDREGFERLLSEMERYERQNAAPGADRREQCLQLLSPREREIALLAADRKTNREIADALCVSENTVKSALRLIFQKLGLDDGGRGKKQALEDMLKG